MTELKYTKENIDNLTRNGDSNYPNLQTTWDSTSLGMFLKCPRKYYLRMQEHLAPSMTSHHLSFGSLVHKGAELYERYKITDQLDPMTAKIMVIETIQKMLADEPVQWIDNYKNDKTLIRTINQYMQFVDEANYKTYVITDPETGKKTPAVEQHFNITLPIKTPSGVDYSLVGHLDKVVEDSRGLLWNIDYKTTKMALSSFYFNGFDFKTQMLNYLIAMLTCFPPEKVGGVIVSGIQVQVGETRIQDYRPPLRTYHADLALKNLCNVIKYYEFLSLNNNLKEFHNTESCADFGACDYKELCSAEPRFQEGIQAGHFVKTIWNPAEERT